MKYLIILMVCFMLLGCGKERNIFLDEVMQQIYTLQDERSAEPLFTFLKDENPKYRRAAALAFASVQDKKAVEPLAALLADENEDVRAAAAYSLGQTRAKTAEPLLVKAFEKEESPVVKRDILEALGKCGTKKGLDFITAKKFRSREEQLLIGQGRGIYRFALQNMTSPQGTERAVELLAQAVPDTASLMAGHYLARARAIDLTAYEQELIDAFTKETNPLIRMSLILAMGKVKGQNALDFLKGVLTSDLDYRIKVNALRALRSFAYPPVKDVVLELSNHPDVNVSVGAAGYIQAKGVKQDGELYFKKALSSSNWRTRAMMLSAALQHCSADSKKAVSEAVISIYKKSGNIYEKAELLRVLSDDPAAYEFVSSQVFSDHHGVIKGAGTEALVTMRRHKEFPADDQDVQQKFADIFKRALESGDRVSVFLTAAILREPAMNFKALYKSTGFLNETLDKLDLQKDMDAYRQLQRTIAFFRDEKTEPSNPPLPKKPLDWELVASIDPGQVVKLKTTKGDISITLFINESPGSAANFTRLLKEGFFRDGVFHRVLPNFVIQGGCPRGDGWGGPGYSIRSEFAPLYYEEGSVGMASSGKDTEGSQWFITHSPTPHLDGQYTIFGKVTAGMDVVHKIELGDRITGFEIQKH